MKRDKGWKTPLGERSTKKLEGDGNVLHFGSGGGFMGVHICDNSETLIYFKWGKFIVCKLNLNRVVKKQNEEFLLWISSNEPN